MDSSYLQAHRKNIIKRQDVIYGDVYSSFIPIVQTCNVSLNSDPLDSDICVCVLFSELIQTELHHMRTLHIMERVFRQGMLDELQMDLYTVHAMFPCLDQLIRIHSHFLAQLLLRHNCSLQPGSYRNYTIHQLGDILLEQVTETLHTSRRTRTHLVKTENTCV